MRWRLKAMLSICKWWATGAKMHNQPTGTRWMCTKMAWASFRGKDEVKKGQFRPLGDVLNESRNS